MKLIRLIFLIIIFSFTAYSQSKGLDGDIINYVQQYSVGYLKPLVEAIGENVATCWSNFTPLESKKFSFDIGMHSSLMFVSDEQKTFQTTSPYDGTAQIVPTIVGSSIQVPISRPNISDPVFPDRYLGGYEYSTVPLFVPHISLGGVSGTRVMVRFLPKVKVYDFAYVSTIGVGVQHSISRYFKKLPLGISLTTAYQYVSIADIAYSNSYLVSTQIYKNISVISFYADLGYKYTNATIDYTATYSDPNDPNKIKSQRVIFDIKGRNGLMATGGIALNLYVFKLNLGYTVTKPQSLTLGIGLGLLR